MLQSFLPELEMSRRVSACVMQLGRGQRYLEHVVVTTRQGGAREFLDRDKGTAEACWEAKVWQKGMEKRREADVVAWLGTGDWRSKYSG